MTMILLPRLTIGRFAIANVAITVGTMDVVLEGILDLEGVNSA